MIRCKEMAILYISSLFQASLVLSQWNGRLADYGSYYVPYSQGGSSIATTGPVYYEPVQGCSPSNSGPTYPTQNTVQTFEQYPQNGLYPQNAPYPSSGPYPTFYSPIYSNTPTVSYQGLEQANALSSAYPNQPIIIINNGGNGDSGGNSNNGNNNGKGDFNFGDLAAILLATHRRGSGGLRGEPGPEAVPETAALPAPPAPIVPSQAPNSGFNGDGGGSCNKCSPVTNITIVLPSFSSLSIESKKQNDKDNDGEQNNKGKNNNKKKNIQVQDSDEESKEGTKDNDK